METLDNVEQAEKAILVAEKQKNRTLYWAFVLLGIIVMAVWLNNIGASKADFLALSFDMPSPLVGLLFYVILILTAAISKAISGRVEDTILISMLWMSGAVLVCFMWLAVIEPSVLDASAIFYFIGILIAALIICATFGGLLGAIVGVLVVRLVSPNYKKVLDSTIDSH